MRETHRETGIHVAANHLKYVGLDVALLQNTAKYMGLEFTRCGQRGRGMMMMIMMQ